MKRTVFLIFLFFIFKLNSQTLSDTKWLLQSIDNLESGKSSQITASIKSYIRFESDSAYNGRFCNTFRGKIRTNMERMMRMTTPTGSKLSCIGLDTIELEILELYSKVIRYRIQDGYLYLFTNNRKRLTFKDEAIK